MKKVSLFIFSILALSSGAANAFLGDAQALNLDGANWYTSSGAVASSGNSMTFKSPASLSAYNLARVVVPGKTYELQAQAQKNASGTATIGIRAYDQNWAMLGEFSTVVDSAALAVDIKAAIPAGTANVRAFILTSPRFNGSVQLSNLTLRSVVQQKAPAAVAAPAPAPVVEAVAPVVLVMNKKLLYTPPALTDPVTIALSTGDTKTILDNSKDYIIKLPSVKKVGETWIEGGHNIVIIGGYITLPGAEASNADSSRRAIYIKNATGTVHIEGVLIDASGGGQSDAIDISAPDATVQIENVRVDGIWGFSNQFHADVIQTFGGVKKLLVDKLTGYSAYQGLQVDYDTAPIGSAAFSRVNLVAIHDQLWMSTPVTGSNGGFMLWLMNANDTKCEHAYPITFDNFYVQPRSVSTLGNGIYPTSSDPVCGSVLSADGQTLTFPKLPIVGKVTKGLPPEGDFVPQGITGVAYASPGYQN